jgi:hypothetical protein
MYRPNSILLFGGVHFSRDILEFWWWTVVFDRELIDRCIGSFTIVEGVRESESTLLWRLDLWA